MLGRKLITECTAEEQSEFRHNVSKLSDRQNGGMRSAFPSYASCPITVGFIPKRPAHP